MSFEQKYLTEFPKAFKESFGQGVFEKRETFFHSFTHNAPFTRDYNKFIAEMGAHFYSLNIGSENAVTENFKRDSIFDNFMTEYQLRKNKKQSENYLPKNLRNQIKDKYGISVSENPSDEEKREVFGIVGKDLLNTTESILSKQKSTNLKLNRTIKKLEKTLEEIEKTQKNW